MTHGAEVAAGAWGGVDAVDKVGAALVCEANKNKIIEYHIQNQKALLCCLAYCQLIG